MSEFQEFSSRLLSGERIVWSGRPQQGILFTATDVYLVPFSLLWGGFAIFWESSVTGFVGFSGARNAPPPTFFMLWGVPFVLAGLYMIVGRFLHDAWLRSRTRYALTERRALILRGGQLTAIDLQRLSTVQLKGGARGTIVFGAEESFNFGRSRGFGVWLPSLVTPPRFLGIENAQAVFNRIEATRAQAA